MSELKVTGRLHKIFDTNQISDSFKKRDFVIETEDQYPQMVKFELIKDKTSKIDDYNVGDSITVHFNVRGRCWTNKNNEEVYFVSLNCWRLEKVGNAPATTQSEGIKPEDWTEDTQLPF